MHYRVAPRELLIAELLDFAADRQSHGKLERAARARMRAAELEAGAARVGFERVWHVVGAEPDRYTLYRGSRNDVCEQLEADGLSAVHVGAEEIAREAARALDAVQTGADRARVGHIVYELVPDPRAIVHPQPLHDAPSSSTVRSG
jgi:hypothetical protein